MEDDVVKHRWYLEVGDRRLEPLTSVSGLALDQEYVKVPQSSRDEKPVPDFGLGAPEFFGTLTLTRSPDHSDLFTQWISDSKDPAREEAGSQSLVLSCVNERNEVVKRFQVEGARVASWSRPDLSAGDSSAVEETLELTYVSVNPI
ncbi:phage tail protein [Streptomyces sp. NPDC002602]|uniref:phage tail protein n=1 Tax=Streptomyces sp. NPDC002602 TaxID=3364654 RepID=UPI0036C79697